jgi:hypothetical protein
LQTELGAKEAYHNFATDKFKINCQKTENAQPRISLRSKLKESDIRRQHDHEREKMPKYANPLSPTSELYQ